MKVEYKIIAAFSLAFLTLVLVAGLTYFEVRTLLGTNQWVVHTYQALGLIDDVFDSVDEIESGGRGFLLTGRSDYLQPYQSGIDSIGAQLDDLQRLTADNPTQQESIASVRILTNRVIADLHEKIDLRQREGLEAVLPKLGLESKEHLDQVRFATTAMKSVERKLLQERTRRSDANTRTVVKSLAALIGLDVVVLFAFLGFIRHDLAERQRSETAVRLSDQKFRGVMESAPDAMVITDQEGAIQMVNSEAEKLFGYPRTDFSGRNLDEFLLRRGDQEDDGSEAGEPEEPDSAVRRLQKLSAKFDGVRKGGELFPIDLNRSPLELGDEHLVIAVIRDRTLQQSAEDALSRYSADLARSNAELERFAYVASHDLQEPLRMISSYTQLLAKRYRDKLDANAHEFINFAVDGASRMQKLINDLLALSRVGTQARPSEPVDTGATLRRVIADMAPTLESAGADVVAAGDLPTVCADGTQIGQLFQNLIGNAIKFRGDDPPRVEVSTERSDDDFWQFSFRDNGIGIEPQYFERIFVIFQRLHGKERYPGTGIGLAICKKIVERHGGRLWVESRLGAGATFHFTLPVGPC